MTGEEFSEIMSLLGVSEKELASVLNVSRQRVWHYRTRGIARGPIPRIMLHALGRPEIFFSLLKTERQPPSSYIAAFKRANDLFPETLPKIGDETFGTSASYHVGK